jgi:inhibitor of cysteine peptidase
MKSKIFVLLIVATSFLILGACSSAKPQYSVEAQYDEFAAVQETISRHVTKSIDVPAGSSFTVALWSNQTTGFKWSGSAVIGDQTIVQQTDHKYVAPEAKEVVGAAGNEVWTFKAVKAGTTMVSMEYSQPWEGGQKDAFGFFLTVNVK